MFETTQPTSAAGLMRISEFSRHHDGATVRHETGAGGTRLAALNPSLLQDLLRFERERRPGAGLDLLEVLAAARRHGRALLLHLQMDYRVLPLTVQPVDHLAWSPLSLQRLLQMRLPDLRVLRVEPAPAGTPAAAPEADAEPLHRLPLNVLLWELALRGAREQLLPEIAGVAAYRVAPGTDLSALDITGSMAAAVAALRRVPVPLREIATWEGFDHARAMRMLNGLYLQAGLMITRTHPGAIT